MLSTALSVVGLGGQYPNLPGTPGNNYSEEKMIGYIEATNNYTVGTTLLSAKDFEHAGHFFINAFSNKEWANSCFTVEESPLTYEDGSVAGKVVDYYRAQGNSTYLTYSEYYGEDLENIAYSECFVIIPCGNNWITSACYSPEGIYIPYTNDEIENPEIEDPEIENPEIEEPEIEELEIEDTDKYPEVTEKFLYGKQLAAKGNYEEAGKCILEAMSKAEWVDQYFDIEETMDEPNGDEGVIKRVVRYWAQETDCYATAVMACYVNNPEVMDYFFVRAYENGDTDSIIWLKYTPDGTFLGL